MAHQPAVHFLAVYLRDVHLQAKNLKALYFLEVYLLSLISLNDQLAGGALLGVLAGRQRTCRRSIALREVQLQAEHLQEVQLQAEHLQEVHFQARVRHLQATTTY